MPHRYRTHLFIIIRQHPFSESLWDLLQLLGLLIAICSLCHVNRLEKRLQRLTFQQNMIKHWKSKFPCDKSHFNNTETWFFHDLCVFFRTPEIYPFQVVESVLNALSSLICQYWFIYLEIFYEYIFISIVY